MNPGLELAGQSKVDDAQDLKDCYAGSPICIVRGKTKEYLPKSCDRQELEYYLLGIASHKATKVLLLLLVLRQDRHFQ